MVGVVGVGVRGGREWWGSGGRGRFGSGVVGVVRVRGGEGQGWWWGSGVVGVRGGRGGGGQGW